MIPCERIYGWNVLSAFSQETSYFLCKTGSFILGMLLGTPSLHPFLLLDAAMLKKVRRWRREKWQYIMSNMFNRIINSNPFIFGTLSRTSRSCGKHLVAHAIPISTYTAVSQPASSCNHRQLFVFPIFTNFREKFKKFSNLSIHIFQCYTLFITNSRSPARPYQPPIRRVSHETRKRQSL